MGLLESHVSQTSSYSALYVTLIDYLTLSRILKRKEEKDGELQVILVKNKAFYSTSA